MRLPKALRGPAAFPRGWWLAGVGVAFVASLVAFGASWHEVGRRVLDSELPRPRFHTDPSWAGVRCTGFDGCAVLSVDRRGQCDIPIAGLTNWFREERGSFYVRAHRHAPWSAVARVLDAAARGGQSWIGLQVGLSNYLDLELLDDSAADVTIATLPLADPERTMAMVRETLRSGGEAPVLRLAFAAGDPDVESVLHALECYADDHPRVRLLVRP